MDRSTRIALALLLLTFTFSSRPSEAAVKQYFSDTQTTKMCELTTLITTCAFTDPDTFHISFFVLRNPQGIITVQPTPSPTRMFSIEDEGLGTVTLHQFLVGTEGQGTTNGEGTFGPGGILFIRAKALTFAGTPQGPFTGSTSAGGTIDWGLVTGFDGTGEEYCESGNGALCAVIARTEDMSVSAVVPSATYDIGTWTFDASGHFTSPPYIRGTLLGGTANTIWIMNGGMIDNALPALPLLGLGALGAGLLAVGGRGLWRRRIAGSDSGGSPSQGS